MSNTSAEAVKCEGWCHDPMRQPSHIGHFLDCAACVLFKKTTAERDALRAQLDAARAQAKTARDALVECRDELDAYSQNEYPSDHPVHVRYRQRDYAANPARIALALIQPTDPRPDAAKEE